MAIVLDNKRSPTLYNYQHKHMHNTRTYIPAITYLQTNGGRLDIDLTPLMVMMRYVPAKPYAPRSRGLLLGENIEDTLDNTITEVTRPRWFDPIAYANPFWRTHPHMDLANHIVNQSNTSLDLLGYWQTTPKARPWLSQDAISQWRSIAHSTVSGNDYIHVLILGTKVLRIWEVSKISDRFDLLGEWGYEYSLLT